jgi:hypothetical protein
MIAMLTVLTDGTVFPIHLPLSISKQYSDQPGMIRHNKARKNFRVMIIGSIFCDRVGSLVPVKLTPKIIL